MNENQTITKPKLDHRNARKVFKKLGTCSRTFAYVLNREFGNNNENRERAADPLSGGIMRLGHQCGMLWGSSLAVGAEAYRRCDNMDEAISVAIMATQSVIKSFLKSEGTINCREVTNCDFNNKWSFIKYMISGNFLYCFKMAEKWGPEAIQSAKDGLEDRTDITSQSISCASEVAKKMGASDEEIVMVAGFAGGLGLSGSGCGALSAAIYLGSLDWCREIEKKSPYNNPNAEKTLKAFQEFSGDKILCSEILGGKFNSIKAHSDYILNDGCKDLIDLLAASNSKNEQVEQELLFELE